MRKRIITISREYGSGGRYLGRELANQLGIKFYDKEIISEVAKETGFAKEFIEQKGEYSPKKSIFSYAFVGRNENGQSLDDILYSAQAEIIQKAADKAPCVIVGRNADYILKDRDDVVNIFVYADKDFRTERISRLYNKTKKEAQKLIDETDKKRSIHYNYYTDRKWGKVQNYTIALNSGAIGFDKCIEIIKSLICMK